MSNAWVGWVTLYTDANTSAWAAYARADERLPTLSGAVAPRIEGAGSYPHQLDSTLAECLAVLEGVRLVLGHWSGVEGVGIRTDCQGAVSILKHGAKPHRRPDLRQVQADLIRALGRVRHRIQWVRGHSAEKTAQAWLNNRVDAAAARARG